MDCGKCFDCSLSEDCPENTRYKKVWEARAGEFYDKEHYDKIINTSQYGLDEEGNIDYDSGPKGFLKKKPNNWLTEKEEDIKEEDIDEMHCSEEDDIVKEETNEEINRWQKLAGL